MSRLFAEVYMDEDVSVLVCSLLTARGFKALTTRDAGQLGRSDSSQLEYAAGRGMVFLTHNRADFEAIHEQYLAANKRHWGIIIASRRLPHAIVTNLLRLLNAMTADELCNQLFYV